MKYLTCVTILEYLIIALAYVNLPGNIRILYTFSVQGK